MAFLGTNDFPSIECSAEGKGSLDAARCDQLIHALCYQVAKSITGLAAYSNGAVDAVVITGGLAYSKRVVREITDRVSFLGPVLLYPGENELEALAMGAREVLLGETDARTYEG